MLGYQFHPEASLEYGEAVDYFIEINPLLADAFVGEVEGGDFNDSKVSKSMAFS